MKKISLFLGLVLGLGINTTIAQIQNSKITTVAVNGNCAMCKKTIESNGSDENISKVNWDPNKKVAEITYDSSKTSEESILKKIAQAGYDNDQFRAADDVYDNLHECCKYERNHQTSKGGPNAPSQHDELNHSAQTKDIDPVFISYLGLKDALVASDSKTASVAANKLSLAIQKVDMSSLAETEHKTWMKVKANLEKSANQIKKDSKIDAQRNTFMLLSTQIYELAKVAETKMELYYQFCPMANNSKGAFWLSKENAIKNPYYGSKMMTCGEVKEKI